MKNETPILSVRNLSIAYGSMEKPLVVLNDFNLDLYEGETVGIIGESGSGKTTAVRALVDLLPVGAKILSGNVSFRGKVVLEESRDRLAEIRGGGIGMIFQSASASINPLFRIGYQLRETLKAHGRWDENSHDEMTRLLTRLGFSDPKRVLRSYPHELSGGMLQRASIALAVALSPDAIIADECTSSLDVTTQIEVVGLLKEITSGQRGMIYVTHDLLLASELCTSLIVMYKGRIVERGTVEEVLRTPRDECTRALLRAIPKWAPRGEKP